MLTSTNAWMCIVAALILAVFTNTGIPLARADTVHAAISCRIYANNFPPLNIIDAGEVRGFSIDLLEEVYAHAGLSLDSCNREPVPFARGFRETALHQHNIALAIARTSEREALFRWVGPIYTVNMSIIAHKHSRIAITDAQSLKSYQIGVLRGTGPDQILSKLLGDEGRISRISSLHTMLRAFEKGRVEMIGHVFDMATYEMRALGLDVTKYEEVFPLGDVDVYFAFSPDTPEALISRLQASLDHVVGQPGWNAEDEVRRYSLPVQKADQAKIDLTR